MTVLQLTEFHGLAPKFNRRRLGAGYAQLAANLRFDSGDLRPLRGVSVIPSTVGGVDAGDFYIWRDGVAKTRVYWGKALTVDFFRGPVPNDSFKRVYWVVNGDGLAAAEKGMFAINDPANPNPAAYGVTVGAQDVYRQFKGYRVGVHPPAEAPGAVNTTPETVIGYDIESEDFYLTRIGSVSNTNPAKVEAVVYVVGLPLPVDHPFKDGQSIKVRISEDLPKPTVTNPDPPTTGGGVPPEPGPSPPPTDATTRYKIWELDGNEYTVGNSADSEFDLLFADLSGFDDLTLEEIDAIEVKRVIRDEELRSRAYVFTYVTEHGEEGPPSPASNIIDVLPEEATVRLTITQSAAAPALVGQPELIDTVRVYRTATGSQDTRFLFVGSLPMDGGVSEDNPNLVWQTAPVGTAPLTSFVGVIDDSTDSVELGEELPSLTWCPPPSSPDGMALMDNGFFVIWKGDTLYFSEPYMPHAWPEAYRRVLDEVIVSVATRGKMLVVGTHAQPRIGTGVDPSAVTINKAGIHAPLVHRKAMIDVGIGIAYPSTDGLVLIAGTATYVTQALYDKKKWLEVIAGRDKAIYHDNRYLMFGEGKDPLMLDINSGSIEASILTDQFNAAAIDDDELLIIMKAGSVWNDVRTFNDVDVAITSGTWRSGLIRMPKPITFGVAQLLADNYPVTLKLYRPNPTTFDGTNFDISEAALTFDTYTVTGEEPFRLNDIGFLNEHWVIQIEATSRVQELVVCSTMDELRQL